MVLAPDTNVDCSWHLTGRTEERAERTASSALGEQHRDCAEVPVSSFTPGWEFVESFLGKKENKGVFPAVVCCGYLEVAGRGLKTECSTGRRQNS